MAVQTLSRKKKIFIKQLTELSLRKDVIKIFADTEPSIFFDSLFEEKFYTDELIPIGYGQTGDNPLVLAKMINYLNPDENDRILEIGTGSGFSTSILSMLCREIYTIEYIEDLAVTAKSRLYSHGYENIKFYAGDATVESDTITEVFDKIIIHASCKKRPLSIMALLKEHCPIVYPMGPANQQQIIRLTNSAVLETGKQFKTEFLDMVNCSHITGPYGYNIDTPPNEFFEDSPESFGVNESSDKDEKGK